MEKVEIEKEMILKYQTTIKNYREKYSNLEKLELTQKQITQLRKQIKEEYKNDSYTNYLRSISLFTQTQDPILKLYINKLYIKFNP